jgi:hypothetical protein
MNEGDNDRNKQEGKESQRKQALDGRTGKKKVQNVL